MAYLLPLSFTEFHDFNLVVEGGRNNVVDNFRDSLDPVAGGHGFELHDRRVHSPAARPSARSALD